MSTVMVVQAQNAPLDQYFYAFIYKEPSNYHSMFDIDSSHPNSDYPTELIGVPSLSSSDPGDEYIEKVEPYNPIVHDKAMEIAAKYPGNYSIDQIFAIYDYLYSGWHYVTDPKQGDYINYANESIRTGKTLSCAGVGDCEDFAILMASLIESIGGTTRIIHTQGEGGHAYAEVYIGTDDNQDQIDSIMLRLVQKYDLGSYYNPMNIFCHETSNSISSWVRKDLWLNLDWFAAHPGGGYEKGYESGVIWANSHDFTRPDSPQITETLNSIAYGIGKDEKWATKGSENVGRPIYQEDAKNYYQQNQPQQSSDARWAAKGSGKMGRTT